MTTSSIGNKYKLLIPALKNFQKGFTFVEIMTTLAILAGGLVMIYKSFFICLDYQTHLACRAQANNIIEHRIALTEQMLRDYKTLSFNRDAQKETVEFFGRDIEYQVDVALIPKGEGIGLYQIDVKVAWRESKRDVALNRSAYISSLASIRKI